MDKTYRAISKIYGRSEQTSTLHGYNLFQNEKIHVSERTTRGLVVRNNRDDSSIHIKGTAEQYSSMWLNPADDGVLTVEPGTYVFTSNFPARIYYGTSSTYYYNANTPFTITSATTFVNVWIGIVIGETYDTDVRFQLEKGSDAHAYEPYIGGTPSPNPYHPEPIRNITQLNFSVRRNGRIIKEASITPPFALNGIGEYRDVLNVVGGKWERNIANVKLGTLNYIHNGVSSDGSIQFITRSLTDRRTSRYGLCTHFTVSSVAKDGSCFFRDAQIGVTFNTKFANDAVTFAQIFADSEVIYQLAQVVNIPISSSDLEILNSIQIRKGEQLFVTDQYGNSVEFETVEREIEIDIPQIGPIPTKIVVGDVSEPIITFEGEEVQSVVEEIGVSAIGEELFIDNATPVVNYELLIRQEIVPKDRDTYEHMLTSDGYVICGRYNYDVRRIPYGTPIRFYSDGKITGLYYCDTVDRVAKNKFQINCVSAIGLMDKQRHVGGLYFGTRFDDVLREIIGDEYEYDIEPGVADVQVFGWLPYATRRANLHQLLVAYGVVISKTDSGHMLFTFVNAAESYNVPTERVFSDGAVKYGDPASRVEITEHSFYYLGTVEEKSLFDTQGVTATNTVVVFDEPVYVDSLRVADGNLTIHECGVNYAVVSGDGTLVGKPYIHNIKLLSKDNDEAMVEKIVTVENATLITLANSDNALERISEYYFNATTITEDIKVEDERCGRRYNIENAFREMSTGFLSRMLITTSSFRRAECDFITDYVPRASGASFKRRELIEPTIIEERWDIPEIVYEKDVAQIRVIMIGRGKDGEDGEDGGEARPATDTDGGLGGLGGKGGEGGEGGKILSLTIPCDNLAFIRYGKTAEGEIYLKVGDDYYTTANGRSSNSGVIEMFTGAIYALPGVDGIDGAPGGKGGINPPISTIPKKSTAGENVEADGVTWRGGGGTGYTNMNGGSLGVSSNLTIKWGGDGGGGAAYGSNGGDATTGGTNVSGYHGGHGADAAPAIRVSDLYGTGGSGGNGGGGPGGPGTIHWWNHEYSSLVSTTQSNPGNRGKGSKGTPGVEGCMLIYY